MALEISLKPEELFHIGSFPVTNSFFFSIVISLLLITVFAIVSRKPKTVPGKGQLVVETFLVGIYDFIYATTGKNSKLTSFVFPIIATLILFLLTSNLMGFIPGSTSVFYHGHHFFRAPTADYGFIFTLAVMMLGLVQVAGLMFAGLGYLKKFINFSGPIDFAVGLLEIVGEFSRIMSLSFRLFGNIFAEEVLALVVLSLAPFGAPLPFSLLGLLVSVIQALIFPILVLIYFSLALAHSDHGSAPKADAVSSNS